MVTVQHNDFGEKIGGAKKDLWQKRGLLSDDLSEMNDREADKYVKKDNIWKKPDYQALIESGIPVDVVYYIKTVRDSLETSPVYRRTDDTPEKRTERQIQYIDTVREVQAVTESVKTKADVFDAFNRCMVYNKYYEAVQPGVSGTYYSVTEKGRSNSTITNKLSSAMFIKNEYDYRTKITYKAEKHQFGVSKDEKLPKGFEIQYNDDKHSWSANNDWKPNTYFVTKGSRIIQKNFETKEAALKWVQNFAVQKGGSGKKRFVPPQLENVKRDGFDYRRGINITGDDYLETFGFKGGEFGNWMTQNDRQSSLNFGFDALKDLAVALKISDKDISYQGDLSIAFGARGSGNAVAHYEPLRKVINLTKMKGAGSLAHEWWHGFDDFMGKKMGVKGYLSDNPHKHPLFNKLIETINYKQASPEQAAKVVEEANARIKRNAESWLKGEILPYIKKSGDENKLAEYEALKDAFLNGEKSCVDKFNNLKKSVTNKVIPKDIREKLELFERLLSSRIESKEPATAKIETDYYRNSKEMGKNSEKDGDYWESNVEMTARAFAIYVLDTLPYRSDYLCGHAECAVDITADKDGNPKIIIAFPQGEERKAINAVFDEIIAELKLQKHLTHDEHTPLILKPIMESKKTRANVPERFSFKTDFKNNVNEQITLFDIDPEKKNVSKPSILSGLGVAKTIVVQNDKQTHDIIKKKEGESL